MSPLYGGHIFRAFFFSILRLAGANIDNQLAELDRVARAFETASRHNHPRRRHTRSNGAFNSTKVLCLAIHSPAFASVPKLLIVIG